ncbi:MAG: mandelate racemase/muconate lactonizing enzyme family protein [Bryobacteraceae bacterium]
MAKTAQHGLNRRRFANVMGGAALIAGKAAPAPMAIAESRLYHLQAPTEQPVKTAFGVMTARHLVLLELRDELGNRGFGESWINFPAWAPGERVAAFRTAFLPYLKGRQVEDIPAFIRDMGRAFRGPAVQSGTTGPLVSALCAVSMALTDLAAKRRKVPLAQLLFNAPSPRVKIYGSGINAPLPWKWIDRLLDRGVTLFKLKLGFGDDEDLANLKALKAHLGSEAAVAVDVNRNWTLSKARQWAGRLAGYEVRWLEEPLTVEDEPLTGELAADCPVPLAGGENILLEPGGDIGALAASPFAIVQPDATKYCTTHDFLRVIPEAARRGKKVLPHFLGSAPGQAFSIHLAAGCSEPLVEWDINANPLHTEMLAEGFTIEEGGIAIPDAPGLGWTPKLQAKDRVA